MEKADIKVDPLDASVKKPKAGLDKPKTTVKGKKPKIPKVKKPEVTVKGQRGKATLDITKPKIPKVKKPKLSKTKTLIKLNRINAALVKAKKQLKVIRIEAKKITTEAVKAAEEQFKLERAKADKAANRQMVEDI